MKEDRSENWKLFLATGMPEAYTYLKAKERQSDQKEKSPGDSARRG